MKIHTFLRYKGSLFLLLMILALVLLTACGKGEVPPTGETPSGDVSNPADSETPSPGNTDTIVSETPSQEVPEEKSVYLKISEAFESGGYAKADELYEEKILGNLVAEDEAKSYFMNYFNGLSEKYNNGELSYDEVTLIFRTVRASKMASLLNNSDAEYNIEVLRESKNAYASGLDARNEGDYNDAFYFLQQVVPLDTNYPDCVSTQVNMLQEIEEDRVPLNLKLLQLCMNSAERISSLTDERVSVVDIEYCQEILDDTQIGYAKHLEEAGHIYHAIYYYNKAGWPHRAKELIQWDNKWSSAPYYWNDIGDQEWRKSGYYHISDNFGLNYIGNNWQASYGYALQAEEGFGWDYDYLAWITPDFTLHFEIDSYLSEYTMVTGFCDRNEGIPAVDIVCAREALIVLMPDGSVYVDTVDPSCEYTRDMEEVQKWTNMVYVYGSPSGFVGITKDGLCLYTSGYYKEYASTSLWSDVGVISTIYSSYHGDYIHVALLTDGRIAADRPLPNGSYVVDAGAKAMKGAVYITEEGKLTSILPEMAEFLSDYSEYNFVRLTAPYGGIIAETENGELLLIDQHFENYWIKAMWLKS